jgi:hypothetical protein
VNHLGSAQSLVEFDMDDAINWHPQGSGLWLVKDGVTGKGVVGVGHVETFLLCRGDAIDVMADVCKDVMDERGKGRGSPAFLPVPNRKHHLLLHSMRGDALRAANRLGYHTVLLHVAVPPQAGR